MAKQRDHKCGLTGGGHNERYIGAGPGFSEKGLMIVYKSVGFTLLISSHFFKYPMEMK